MIKLIKIWNRKDISQFRCYTYIERERERIMLKIQPNRVPLS
jgi:hypothetical protein